MAFQCFCLLVCWVQSLPFGGHVPLHGGLVRPSASVHRTSIQPIEATSATKHLTFSRSIVEANLIGKGEINFSARRRNRNGLSVRSSLRISPILVLHRRRWKVNEIAKLNRKGSAVRGVFDGGKKKEGQRRAGLDFFSEGIIKWAGNYCFPSLPPCPTLITFALVIPVSYFTCGIP